MQHSNTCIICLKTDLLHHLKRFSEVFRHPVGTTLRDNSFPGSLRLKLSPCVTYVSSLAFILSLGSWKMPLYRQTPLLSASPGHFLHLHWRGQCHSLGGGVPPVKLALILTRSFSQIKTRVLGGAFKCTVIPHKPARFLESSSCKSCCC